MSPATAETLTKRGDRNRDHAIQRASEQREAKTHNGECEGRREQNSDRRDDGEREAPRVRILGATNGVGSRADEQPAHCTGDEREKADE